MHSFDSYVVLSSFQLGMPAPDVIIGMAQRIQSLQAMTFSRYWPSQSFEERLANSDNPELRRVHNEANRLRTLTGVDLLRWESIVAASWPMEEYKLLFFEALFHDYQKEASGTFELSVSEVLNDRFQTEIATASDNELLAICSLCRLDDGTYRHIPLMDFHCRPNPVNLEKVKVALSEMNRQGIILESGRSYHFYGVDLLDNDEWIEFMARALLLAPFADSRYIAHRLLGGKSVLRISKSASKPQVPFVVAVVE